MKIYITRSLKKNYEIISDTHLPNIDPKKQYILDFTDGSNTLKAFKHFYLQDKDVIFRVKNMELFYHKINQFRNIEIEFIEEEKEIDIEKMYKEIEQKLGGKNIEKGIEISFYPKVYDSLRTSFLHPKTYKMKKSVPSKIFELLFDKKLPYDELKDLFSKKEQKDFELHLKSMLYAGIIKQKGEFLIINELLK